jgi:basic membrane protein A
MKKLLAIGLLSLAVVLSGCQKKEEAKEAAAEKELSAAFVYVGPVGDGGWTYAHDLGRKELEKMGVKTSYVESVPETDSERVIRNLARKGNKIVYTTSFGFMDATLKVSKDFPDTIFMHASGFKKSENMGNYFGRMYQARYLAGMVAGYMTKTNKIGMIGSMPIPEIIRHINAFTLGARSVNPNVEVQVVWVNTWFDPAKEGDAAASLFDGGNDIIAITTDSAAPVQEAEKRGMWAIGNDTDMSIYGAKAHLTANVWNWGVYYKHIAEQVKNGTWTPTEDWWGIETGIVGLAPFGDMVPENVKQDVLAKKADISSGKLVVFQGPFNKQDGTLAVEAGNVPNDGELLGMSYFVEGVVGTIPAPGN